MDESLQREIREEWRDALKTDRYMTERWPISLLAKRGWTDEFGDWPDPSFALAYIVTEVCRYYGLPRDEIYGKRRHAKVVRARQMVMLLAREHRKHLSLTRIGQLMKRDHTTVMHGAEAARKRIAEDPDYAVAYKVILARLG